MEKKNLNKDKRKDSRSARLKEIIQVLYKYKITEGITPEKFKAMIEELGATYIKIGQILSMRPDILPKAYCDELTKLRKDIAPMPFDEVKSLLKAEFKEPLKSIFASIEEKPLGSASIAQVHKAMLLDGSHVVVKVQKPGIYETMASDITLLKKAFKIVKFSFIENVIDVPGVLDELWSTAKQELDFIIEASHISEFEKNNEDIIYLKTPKVYLELCTTNVLVMEYIDGITINDTKTLLENEYDLDEIALKLADSYIVQIIENGYFHADPHPDNLEIQDGKIVFLDFGMMGRISARDRQILKDCMFAIVNSDVHKIEKCILTIGMLTEEVDQPALLNDLELFMDKYSTLDLGNMNLGIVLNDLFKLTNTYKIKLPKSITMLTRGVVVIEGLLNELSPSIHLIEVLKNRLSNSLFKDLISKENMQNTFKKAIIAQETLLELPKETLDFVKMASRGNAKFNLELSDSDNKMGKLEKMLNKLILAALDVAFIVACSLLYTNTANNTSFEISILRIFSLVSIVVITLLLAMLMLKDARKKYKK